MKIKRRIGLKIKRTIGVKIKRRIGVSEGLRGGGVVGGGGQPT